MTRSATDSDDGKLPDGADPFAAFRDAIPIRTPLRRAVVEATRRDEMACLPGLIEAATLDPVDRDRARQLARGLIETLRSGAGGKGIHALLREYPLSSPEGVALMSLAEALLRIPDAATKDALIRDKIGGRPWLSHVRLGAPLAVNAASLALALVAWLVARVHPGWADPPLQAKRGGGGGPCAAWWRGLPLFNMSDSHVSDSTTLSPLHHPSGGPPPPRFAQGRIGLTWMRSRALRAPIRAGVEGAIRHIGTVFVLGETIEQALARAKPRERDGFRYSFDMLGEAAMTAADAARYDTAYAEAIRAIGASSKRQSLYERAGISIKLSALHPRYVRAQRDRVLLELLPRVKALARLCRERNVGLNIDAEEADRLDLSLDLFEALCADDDLQGWNGLGFVVQAYQKRAPFVLDVLIDLARRTRRRVSVRLVKGAYWDQEIKRAQVAGLDGFPVFTRKVFTDVSYIACARKMLAARDAIYPQFATHNAQTLATIVALAEAAGAKGDYEFQCLHGMGDPLYEAARKTLDVPCRIYAPVGSHETLLAYLVRRLLENGANSSFVNQIADPSVPIETLIADPAEIAAGMGPSDDIAYPSRLYGPDRRNSAGVDLDDERVLAELAAALPPGHLDRAAPSLADGAGVGTKRPILNPANLAERVGEVEEASAELVDRALEMAEAGYAAWAGLSPDARADILLKAADHLESRRAEIFGLIVREAGKSFPNAVAELREAVDFLRYDAAQIRASFDNATHRPLGVIGCISPWNFPLAIFVGQVAAALAAGNAVVAKPAETTPLVADLAVAILREAGVPAAALQLLPGGAAIGGQLVADARVRGVVFTGSTEVARTIQATLANRLGPDGAPIPLIAETAGQNVMIVDSSALPEQVVADVLNSAFDSAGQRCSALRVLCLQDDVADTILALLEGAMQELAVGDPARLSTDVGPVISPRAKETIEAHVEAMRAKGRRVVRCPLPAACAQGTFVAPTLIEIDDIAELSREVFGPVLHVLRFKAAERDALVESINATGYALTFGLHSRIQATIADVTGRIAAGNIYVNRNIVGAVVGVQPFGGHGLSGTGPKAGGPLYLHRLLSAGPAPQLEREQALPSPVGERNVYTLHPRGTVLSVAADARDLTLQVEVALAAGNRVMVWGPTDGTLPDSLRDQVVTMTDIATDRFDVALFAGPVGDLGRTLAERPGAIIPLHRLDRETVSRFRPEWLMTEQVVTTNTAAAGGAIDLLTIAT